MVLGVLWEVIRVREGHVGEAHIMGSGALSHEWRSLFVPYEDIAEKAVSMPTIAKNHYVYYLDNTGYTKNG